MFASIDECMEQAYKINKDKNDGNLGGACLPKDPDVKMPEKDG